MVNQSSNNEHLPVAQQQFFQRLTRLLRSGPSIKRRIKGFDPKNLYDKAAVYNNLGYYGGSAFRRETSPFSIMGAYSQLDRVQRLAEYSEMVRNSSDCATALDIYANESCSKDEKGNVLQIRSDNAQIQRHLEELFYDVMNMNFDGPRIFRNICMNGDYFSYNEVIPGKGIVHIEPLPGHAILREEKYDPDDPFAIRFKLIEHGGKYLENWQVNHFRLMNAEEYLPYGTSIFEAARRPFRQLILMEDSMLVYRIVRSSARKVFSIDITSIPADEVNNYVQQVAQTFKSNSIVDKTTGRMDQRYAPISQLDDIFIPVKPNSLNKVESLPAEENSTFVEDVEFIHKRLTAALRIPRPYLGYDDLLSSKANLSQEDTRFAKLIDGIQQQIIPVLNEIAIIHLYALGFDGDDLVDFDLQLTKPNSLIIQQKLNIWTQRLKVIDAAKNTEMFDTEFILKEFAELSDDQIMQIRIGLERDKMFAKRLEAKEPPKHEKIEDDAVIDALDINNYQTFKTPPSKEQQKPGAAKNPRKPLPPQTIKSNEVDKPKQLPSGNPLKPSLMTILGKSFVSDSFDISETEVQTLEMLFEELNTKKNKKNIQVLHINQHMKSKLKKLSEHIKLEQGPEVEIISEELDSFQNIEDDDSDELSLLDGIDNINY